MSILHSLNRWIDSRFDAQGISAFRSIRIAIFTFVPILIAVGIVEIFAFDVTSGTTLALYLIGGAASIGLLLWVFYRSAMWAQKVTIERSDNKTEGGKNG